jgi:Bacterial protein of unknown function (DUF922)
MLNYNQIKFRRIPDFPKLSIVICFLWISASHRVEQPFIAWTEGYHLSPADYLGRVDYNSPHTASTSYSVSNRWDWLNDSVLQIEIICRFYPHSSWMKANPTAELLIHEQKHFDLGEVYARQMRKKLQTVVLNTATCNQEVEQIVNETRNDCFTRQRAYDAATAHGVNTAQQQFWNELIIKALNELQPYADKQFAVFPK